jgi:hypothetical protein
LSRKVFSGFQLAFEKAGRQKRLVLTDPSRSRKLPFLVGSAGQRELVPLLLGLYWLLPPMQAKRRGPIVWVMIEDVEAGLHPEATQTMLVIVLDLLWRGYRICLSTHSAQVLDLVWARCTTSASTRSTLDVLRMMGVKAGPATIALGKAALGKTATVLLSIQSPDWRGTSPTSNLPPQSNSKPDGAGSPA